MEDHSPQDDILACHLPSIAEEEDDENSHNDLCPYPCPYSLNPSHLTQEEAMQYIDLSNIFEFPDVAIPASDDNVPSLEDILGL